VRLLPSIDLCCKHAFPPSPRKYFTLGSWERRIRDLDGFALDKNRHVDMQTVQQKRRAQQPVVLIIDDDSDFRALIRSYLGRAGYQVIEADDGAKVIAEWCSGCALIMVDLLMPGTEGIETIKRLRKEGVRTKILAISGASHANTYLDVALRLGANSACDKARLLENLLSIVGGLLEPIRNS
jgi:CheY-like chemotaxis protein